ncbi:MAG: hypothetical protein ABL888_22610 [Pirellulaceae bacterium]
MAKFYVTTNDTRLLVQAADGEGAALWALHQHLEQNATALETLVTEAQVTQAFAGWGETVAVSEIGFERAEAGCFRTFEIVQNYCQLMLALERLVVEHTESM